MNDFKGRYGTRFSIVLRVGQMFFSSISIALLIYSKQIELTDGIWFNGLMLLMGILDGWSFLLIWGEMYALIKGIDIRTFPVYYSIIRFGDVNAFTYALAGTNSMASMVLFYTVDTHKCSIEGFGLCTVYLLASISAFVATVCITYSTIVGLWVGLTV